MSRNAGRELGRRELVGAGLAEGKVLRVVGLASAVLFDKSDPLNPVNRRISIIVLTRKAEESMLKDAVPLPGPGNAPPPVPARAVEGGPDLPKPAPG